MTLAAMGIDKKLQREYGADYVGTEEYFRTIDKTMRKRFPEFFAETQSQEDDEPPQKKRAEPADEGTPPRRASKPATVVAPASRSTPPSRVRLKASQAAIARRLGVPSEGHAVVPRGGRRGGRSWSRAAAAEQGVAAAARVADEFRIFTNVNSSIVDPKRFDPAGAAQIRQVDDETGGDDPGAIGVRKLQEKHVTLAISREVAAQLNKMPGYSAVLVRDEDYYVGLRQQINMAHDKHADLFIAIHADGAADPAARDCL